MPRSLRAWARRSLYFFLLFGVGVVFIPWTQTITAQGQLSAYSPQERPQEIHATISGRIKTWHVNEGMEVHKGDLVLELDDVDPKFMAPDLLSRLDQSREALRQQREATLERVELLAERIKEMSNLTKAASTSAGARVAEAGNKVESAEQRLAVAKIAEETALLNLDRSRLLEVEGLISRRDLELAIQNASATKAEVKAAEAAFREFQQARMALGHGRKQIDAELIQRLLEARSQRASALEEAAKASKVLADLELTRSNALQRREASRVVAPLNGTLVRLTRVGAGEIVHPGDTLFTIVPLSAVRAVEMWVEPLNAPLLKTGRKVVLLFHGIPAIPLPAWPEIMAGTYEGVIQVVDQSPSSNGKFRFWVSSTPQGRRWPPQEQVRQGTQVMGWVVLNRVPLWYELWRRFNLFPPDYKENKQTLPEAILPKAGRPGK